LDLIFAVDASANLETTDYLTVLEFVRDIISGMNFAAGSRVGLLVYAATAQVREHVEFGLLSNVQY
jgi:hypothetical protein